MNKVLVITVAGTSSRFRVSLGTDILKCLYSCPPRGSILDRLLSLGIKNNFKKIVIVGGYLFSDLETYIKNYNSHGVELTLVYNDKYEIWGSNFSLYLGLVEVLKNRSIGQIVFTEGDLVFDYDTFDLICDTKVDVVTANQNIIKADSAVVFYIDTNNRIKFYYDPNHNYIEIKEPFLSIYNSGQVWSFSRIDRLRKVVKEMIDSDFVDTNLNIIQKYFDSATFRELELFTFKEWYNCNTKYDYSMAFKCEIL